MKLSPNEIAHVVIQYWASQADQRVAVAVALAESSGDPEVMARSDSGTHLGQRAHGLWQISNAFHQAKLQAGDWRDPYENGGMAYLVWQEGGNSFKPWSTFTGGAYQKYLPDADFGLAAPWPAPRSQGVQLRVAADQVANLRALTQSIRTHFA